MAAIIRKWLGTGWLSLYKNNGPAITMTVIKIVPPRLLKRERSVRWLTSSVITLERLPNGTLDTCVHNFVNNICDEHVSKTGAISKIAYVDEA